MQNNWWVILAGLEILLCDDFKTFRRLNAFKDQFFINALGNRDIAIGALIRVQSMRIVRGH